MRLLHFVSIAIVLGMLNAPARAATFPSTATAPTTTAPTTTASLPEVAEEKAWSFSLAAYAYFVPDSRDYVQPTFMADRDWLHLEARYNYEALDSGSVWVGY